MNKFISNLKQVNPLSIDLKALFRKEYLVELSPGSSFLFEQWVYVFVIINLLLIIGVFVFISKGIHLARPQYKFLKRISVFWVINTVFLFFYNLFRTGGVRFFSMRLFLLIIFVVYIGIILYGIGYYFFCLPKVLKKYLEIKEREKYLKRRK
jgi:hypothetical protein